MQMEAKADARMFERGRVIQTLTDDLVRRREEGSRAQPDLGRVGFL